MTCAFSRMLNCFTQKIVKVTAIVLAVLALSAPTVCRAQSPTLKLKENDKLEANGNARQVYEIKLSQAMYTKLKKNTPNTALFIRKVGLHDQNMVIENVKG